MNRLRRSIAGGFLSVPTGGFTLIVVVAILWLTLARSPFGDTPMPHIPGLDKVVHACMFGGLTFVGELDCSRWRIKRRNLRGDAALVGWHLAAVIALASIAFGGAIELLQGAMHMGRGADWLDWLADAVGAAVAVVVSPPVVRWVLALKR